MFRIVRSWVSLAMFFSRRTSTRQEKNKDERLRAETNLSKYEKLKEDEKHQLESEIKSKNDKFSIIRKEKKKVKYIINY